MLVEAFDFNLPEENIALRPISPRDTARLLCVQAGGALQNKIVGELPDLLNAGDVLVVNDTKVIPARLEAERHRAGATGSKIEVTLIERLERERRESVRWRCFLKPAKRVKQGDTLHFGELRAEVISRTDGAAEIVFQLKPEEMEVALAQSGAMPLPPYIAAKRKPDARDNEDYQTLFAVHDGAVAAPTAGLHFTPDLKQKLEAKGIQFVTVTLHVGPGTFLPMKADNTKDHVMHSEWGEVTKQAADKLNAAKQDGGKLICVGTTSLRLIESATSDDGLVQPFEGTTDIFITPGYHFKATDKLMTNFHLPKSTLFMLVSAFSGLAEMKNAYHHAIENGYRFYSYGDACLLDCTSKMTAKNKDNDK